MNTTQIRQYKFEEIVLNNFIASRKGNGNLLITTRNYGRAIVSPNEFSIADSQNVKILKRGTLLNIIYI